MAQVRHVVGLLMGVVVAVLGAAIIFGLMQQSQSVTTDTHLPTHTVTYAPQTQTKTAGCLASGGLQDSSCTPGAVFSGVTVAEICRSGYASSVRNVPESEKQQAYAEYGIVSHTSGQYEVDHLISLELGGSNELANLWPEAAEPTPGFHQKDAVENYLHAQVCDGKLSLSDAQQKIATNWLAVYQTMPPQ